MTRKEPTETSFEKRLDALEALVGRMEGGGLQLDELVKLYEEGMKLSESLKKELDGAQAKLQILKGGTLQEAEEANGV